MFVNALIVFVTRRTYEDYSGVYSKHGSSLSAKKTFAQMSNKSRYQIIIIRQRRSGCSEQRSIPPIPVQHRFRLIHQDYI